MGAAFTYFVKDEVKTLKQKRQEDEKEKIKKGEPIRYPTYEELEAETREEEPYLLFTIRDLSGSIVRELKTGISKGLHRIHWDGRFPSINPVRLQGPAFDNPFANLDEGVLAMPGEYTVSLSQSINGQLRELAAPQRFRLNSLGGVTLPAADRAELVAFQRQAQDLQRVVSGAGSMLGEINNRMQHIRKAIFSVGAPKSELVNDFKAIEAKLYAIRKTMYGDNIAATLDKDDPFTVASRIGWLTGEMWGSTSAPTQTQRDALRIADEEFKPLLEQIRSVRNNDLRILEEKLEKAGAPYTPGRDVKRD